MGVARVYQPSFLYNTRLAFLPVVHGVGETWQWPGEGGGLMAVARRTVQREGMSSSSSPDGCTHQVVSPAARCAVADAVAAIILSIAASHAVAKEAREYAAAIAKEAQKHATATVAHNISDPHTPP